MFFTVVAWVMYLQHKVERESCCSMCRLITRRGRNVKLMTSCKTPTRVGHSKFFLDDAHFFMLCGRTFRRLWQWQSIALRNGVVSQMPNLVTYASSYCMFSVSLVPVTSLTTLMYMYIPAQLSLQKGFKILL